MRQNGLFFLQNKITLFRLNLGILLGKNSTTQQVPQEIIIKYYCLSGRAFNNLNITNKQLKSTEKTIYVI